MIIGTSSSATDMPYLVGKHLPSPVSFIDSSVIISSNGIRSTCSTCFPRFWIWRYLTTSNWGFSKTTRRCPHALPLHNINNTATARHATISPMMRRNCVVLNDVCNVAMVIIVGHLFWIHVTRKTTNGSEKMPRASLPWGMPGEIRPSAYPELLRMDIHFQFLDANISHSAKKQADAHSCRLIFQTRQFSRAVLRRLQRCEQLLHVHLHIHSCGVQLIAKPHIQGSTGDNASCASRRCVSGEDRGAFTSCVPRFSMHHTLNHLPLDV